MKARTPAAMLAHEKLSALLGDLWSNERSRKESGSLTVR